MPVEQIGNEAGQDSQSTRIRRIAALTTECEELSKLGDIAEARQVHLEKLTKDKDAIIKVAPRTDAIVKPDRETTRPLTSSMDGHYSGQRSEETPMDDMGI